MARQAMTLEQYWAFILVAAAVVAFALGYLLGQADGLREGIRRRDRVEPDLPNFGQQYMGGPGPLSVPPKPPPLDPSLIGDIQKGAKRHD